MRDVWILGLDMSEITRCFIYEKEARGSFVRENHPRDAAILDIIRRVPLIVKITGLMLFAHVVCAVLIRDILCSSRSVGAWNQLVGSNARFHCEAMQLSRIKRVERICIASLISSAPTKKRSRIAKSGLIGSSFVGKLGKIWKRWTSSLISFPFMFQLNIFLTCYYMHVKSIIIVIVQKKYFCYVFD